MRIAVMGTGGVGGYFGGRLAAAGEDVTFVARGAHLEAMRGGGLRIESALGDLLLQPVKATERPAEIGPVDVVLFTVKLWDTDAAARAIRPLVGPGTAVVTFQNGVDSAERLAAALGTAPVVGGVCHIAAAIAAPGVIRHTGTLARLTVGELRGGTSGRVAAFAKAARRAGIDITEADDIRRAIWEKFVFLAPFSGVTSLARLPIGPIRENGDSRRLFADAVAEAVAVAAAVGIALPEDRIAEVMQFTDGLPPQMKSSMLGDLERGARLELPWLSGTVARLGRQHGVPTPVHRVIHDALAPHAAGAG